MARRLLIGLLVLSFGGMTVAWFARDALLDMALRQRLGEQRAFNPDFPGDRQHIRVLLCGTGSPEVSSARAQACTLVAAGGRLFLFDAGDGAVRSLATSDIAVNRIEGVFITHFHSDHFNDLGPLINASWIWGRPRPLPVYGPVGTANVLDGLARAYALDVGYRSANMPHLAARRAVARGVACEIRFAGDGNPGSGGFQRVYDAGGVTIDAVLVPHDPVRPAVGYVLRYAGKKLFISGDTEASAINLQAMRDADLVVHESYAAHMVRRAIPQMRAVGMQFEAEVATRTIPYHADNLALASLAERAHVKHLLLTHLIPYPDNFLVRRMYGEGMSDRFSGRLTVGQDGLVIAL